MEQLGIERDVRHDGTRSRNKQRPTSENAGSSWNAVTDKTLGDGGFGRGGVKRLLRETMSDPMREAQLDGTDHAGQESRREVFRHACHHRSAWTRAAGRVARAREKQSRIPLVALSDDVVGPSCARHSWHSPPFGWDASHMLSESKSWESARTQGHL